MKRPKPYFPKRKTEVDFYIPKEELLIQVSYSINDKETAKREIKALSSAIKELNITESYIITYDEESEIIIPAGIIKLFLLGNGC